MTALGFVAGIFMVLLAIVHQLPEPKIKPRRRAGGLGHNRKARR